LVTVAAVLLLMLVVGLLAAWGGLHDTRPAIT
jgi:hypothetical protein